MAVIALLLGGIAVLVRTADNHGAGPGAGGGSAGAAPSTTVATTVPPSAPPSSVASTATTAAPSPGALPASPRLSSLTPGQGGAGTVIVLDGTNFFSPTNGVVVASVDGRPARTDCSTQTSCQVTIPAIAAPATSVTITLTTDSGTSNALTFRYR